MANYIFQDINAGLEIKAPAVSVSSVYDHYNGTADVNILISLGSPQADAVTFSVTLSGFTYTDHWTRQELEDWVTAELKNYEV